MEFDIRSFKRSLNMWLGLLQVMVIGQNWSGIFYSTVTDDLLEDVPKSKFGNYFGQAKKWYVFRPVNLTQLIGKSIWFLWIIVVILFKTCGIPFKFACWLILGVGWLIVAFTNNLKFSQIQKTPT